MITGSGRCHGPGCTQTARVEFWCSERCQVAWDRQAAGLPAPLTLERIAHLYEVPVGMIRENPASGWLAAAVEEAQPELARAFTEAIEQATADVSTVLPAESRSPLEEIVSAFDRIEAVPPAEPVKLTRAQLDAIRVECPPPAPFPVPGAIDHLMGRRIDVAPVVAGGPDSAVGGLLRRTLAPLPRWARIRCLRSVLVVGRFGALSAWRRRHERSAKRGEHMRRRFVRSGPTNSRALWHMVNPESRDGLTWCSRRPSGPTSDDPAEVLASPWSWCEKCAERRWAAINQAVGLLRAEAPNLLVKAERLEEGT